MQFTGDCFIVSESKLVFAQYFVAKFIAMQSFWLYQLDGMCRNLLLWELLVVSFPWMVTDLSWINRPHYLWSLKKRANALTTACAKAAFFTYQIKVYSSRAELLLEFYSVASFDRIWVFQQSWKDDRVSPNLLWIWDYPAGFMPSFLGMHVPLSFWKASKNCKELSF